MDRWRGKVAIVTGASAGIGAAIAKSLVEEGLQVVGLARRPELVEELAKQLKDEKGKLHALKADMTVESDILEAFKWTIKNLGPVHILINNAGVIQKSTMIDGNTEEWKKTMDTNVIGLSIATREAVRIMEANKIAGHIVHIGSIAGHKVLQGCNMYAASKFAVNALTETVRMELRDKGSQIKISCVCPGLVKTDILKVNMGEDANKMMTTCPTLSSDDVANAVVYILGTPPHVQIHEMIIKPLGEMM